METQAQQPAVIYDYTREKLIELCNRSYVKESNWNHQDYPDLMIQTAELQGLLRCGCDYVIITPENALPHEKETDDITTSERICIRLSYLPPEACLIDVADTKRRNEAKVSLIFLLPTEEQINAHSAYKETPTNLSPAQKEVAIKELQATKVNIEAYNKAIEEADTLMDKGRAGGDVITAPERVKLFEQAKLLYQKALELSPMSEYAKSCLEEVGKAINSSK